MVSEKMVHLFKHRKGQFCDKSVTLLAIAFPNRLDLYWYLHFPL